MTTQNTQPKNQHGPAEQVVFIEYSTVKRGQHWMAVMGKENGRRTIIARIFREFDPVLKQMNYSAKDREGKAIFPEITSIYDLKKKFIENAKQLSKAIPAEVKNEPAIQLPEQKQPEEKGKKKTIGKKIKDKAQDLTHSLVPEKTTSQDPEKDKVIEQMEREGEINQLRDKKNEKAKGQEINR